MAEEVSEQTNLMDLIRGLVASMELGQDQNKEITGLLDFLAGGGSLADANGLTARDLELIYSTGLTCYNHGKYEDARALFKFLCLMDQTGTKWWMGLGAANQMLKDYESAIKAYAYCTILDVDDPRPQIQAGYCLSALGMHEEAASALEGAILAAGDDERLKLQAEALLSTLQAGAKS